MSCIPFRSLLSTDASRKLIFPINEIKYVYMIVHLSCYNFKEYFFHAKFSFISDNIWSNISVAKQKKRYCNVTTVPMNPHGGHENGRGSFESARGLWKKMAELQGEGLELWVSYYLRHGAIFPKCFPLTRDNNFSL